MKLLFICDNETLYKAYQQVLSAITDITALLVSTPSDIGEQSVDNEDIFIIVGDTQTASTWLWQNIRIKYLNPVIVLGNDEKERFIGSSPAFKEGASKYHKYLAPPHSINQLLDAIDTVRPIYDDDSRKLIYERYGSPFVEDKLYRLIDHDLKLFDKERDLAVLEEALKYANELQNDDLQKKVRSAVQCRKSDDIAELQKLKPSIVDMLKERKAD